VLLEEREVGVVGSYAPLTQPEIYVQLKILGEWKDRLFCATAGCDSGQPGGEYHFNLYR
jgi:hypothetical protein